MFITCYECDAEYDPMVDENCPNCGFGPDRCNHPQEHHESEWVYDAGEGKDVEHLFCGKCGLSASEF